jgi:hypothetical protein
MMQEAVDQQEQEAEEANDKLLEESGAQIDEDIGFVFPGVDISAQSSKKKDKSDQQVTFEKPKMELSTVSSTGKFAFKFNQNMFHPKTIDQAFYNNVFLV